MRCLTPFMTILLVAVVGFAGYNYMQIVQLRGELTAIKAKVHSGAPEPGGNKDLLTALAEVKKHTARAQDLLANGQVTRARLELDKSLRRLEKASSLTQDIAADAGSALGTAWSVVRKEVKGAWDEVSKQMNTRRPGGNESKNGE